MKLRRTPVPPPALLFGVPAFNLALILVVFLLFSSTFLIQPGVAVSMPQSPFILSPQRDPRIISVTGPPLSGIFFQAEQMDLPRLRRELEKIRGRSQTIIIKADGKALYENITAVMNVALELGFPVVLAGTGGDETP